MKAKWRWVESDVLPNGPPVEAGVTIYTFQNPKTDEGHWEYDLPAPPKTQSPGVSRLGASRSSKRGEKSQPSVKRQAI